MSKTLFLGDGLYLLQLNADGSTSADGPHETAEAVARAACLRDRLGLSKSAQARVMVQVSACPEPDPTGIDEDAVKILNGIGLS